MSACPFCHADVPAMALCCVQCGRELVTDTVQDRSTEERLREMLVAKGLLPSEPVSALMGPTLREGLIPGLNSPADGAGARIVPLRTAQEQELFSLAFEDTMSPSPVGATDLLDPTPEPSTLPPETPAPLPPVVARPVSAGPPPPAPPHPPPPSRTEGHPDRMPLPGDVVDQFEIRSEIGRGGMGRVYQAVHRLTGQEVALKMLLPQFSQEPRLRARFLNEAKVLARLEHPNLVPLLGFIEQGSRAFIVMPFVKGITLERMLRRQGRLPLDIVVDLFDQLCAAIEHVHRHNFLHRDLKPSNVIVRGDGRVMVTDFGIARVIGAEQMTLPGMVVGTAEYLAPEQACGSSRDDKRSDIYSLGILLYEMLTGQVPFQHPNAGEVLQRQVSSPPPPPRVVVPELSVELEAVMLRSLAKDPDKRFQSALEFANVVRTTVWPQPENGEPPPASSDLSVTVARSLDPLSGAVREESVAAVALAPTLPQPIQSRERPVARGREALRWAAIILGLAGLGAAVGAWLRLRG